jgi:oxygen-dependent protoporphyrinogen oxidase
VVALVYEPGTAGRLPDATGFIVPPGATAGGQPVLITACTWVSRKWPNPAFGDRAVVRVFVGGEGEREAPPEDELELVAAVCRDIERISPLGDVPVAWAVTPWPRSMPQYEVGHLRRVERIEAALREAPGLFVTGSAYGGVGIADVVRHATETAERVRAHLQMTNEVAAAANAGA